MDEGGGGAKSGTSGSASVSPMLEQYRRIKNEQKENILFFRLGDFYEMFGEDAKEVASLLNITLTHRNGLLMCGVPHHAARVYIARLLKLGKKVALCEQISLPGKGQKVAERQVVEVITPGTTVDEDFLDKDSFNYLAALARARDALSFAYIDLSTGDFYATSFELNDGSGLLRAELERLAVRELLVQESLLKEDRGIAEALGQRAGLVVNRWADWLFDAQAAAKRLQKQFSLSNLKSFALTEKSPQILAAGALLDYLDATSKSLIPHVKTIKIYEDADYVGIDDCSQRNLELLRNVRDADSRYSLLEVVNETKCAMGLRLLKRRILHPLRSLSRINDRLDMVEKLYRDQGLLSRLRDLLGKTPDLERLSSRLAMDKAHGRDMLSVKNALKLFRKIVEVSAPVTPRFEAAAPEAAHSEAAHSEAAGGFDAQSVGRLGDLYDLLEKTISEEPSTTLNEGDLIKSGYSEELDRLHALAEGGRKFLEAYLEEERLATGISSLKIRYNRVIGYFFEVTKTHASRVPPHFIRRQGTVGAERFSSERLAELEIEITEAAQKAADFEKKLFLEIRERAKAALSDLFLAGRCLAELDVSQSLARAASVRGWVKPVLNESGALEIYEGRHPVVEAHMAQGDYIPNDILISSKAQEAGPSFVLLTGPNMAGKSTYLRSAALITLMAQAGSFVPARQARIGLCDRIYCRVGASDNLARGESTFLVEMNETAFILNTASEKSLVIMDEVGRGTGTNDGLSIAWAVSEELLSRVGCRTFFATHYHELSLLAHKRLANRSMEVLDNGGEIVFLRKLKEGPAAESYGLHVAQLAGIAPEVIARARKIMERLDRRGIDSRPLLGPAEAKPEKPRREEGEGLLSVKKALQSLDPYGITPLDALKLIIEWKEKLASDGQAARATPPAPAQNEKPRPAAKNKTPPEHNSLFD